MITQPERTAQVQDMAVIAYCLMPNHLHLVVEGKTHAAYCLEFLRLFKQITAYDRKAIHQGNLWQNRYRDHVLRSTETTQQVVRYMIENPVRAGLVTCPLDHDYSGSCVYTREALFDWAFGVSRSSVF